MLGTLKTAVSNNLKPCAIVKEMAILYPMRREIIKALMAKEIPDRMGLFESFWPHLFRGQWQAEGFPQDGDVVEKFNLDIRQITWYFTPDPRPDLVATVEENDEWKVFRNGWGSTFKYWKHQDGVPEHMDFMVTTPEVWHRDFRDAVVALDVRKMFDLEKTRELYAKSMAEDRFIEFAGGFIFEEMRRTMGDYAMLESLLLEPEWIHDFSEVITQKNIEYYEYLFREVGLPDGMHIYEDLGYTAAPFASPACHRELVLPYHKKLFGFFKDHGLPVVMHTCGDFRPHLDSIVEAGVDCIQTLEAKTGMNVVTLAEQWKDKLCFMGNIDVRALESGDRKRIEEECLAKINGMKALRAPFIFMSDHSISTGVKLADYEYALDVFWKNCKY